MIYNMRKVLLTLTIAMSTLSLYAQDKAIINKGDKVCIVFDFSDAFLRKTPYEAFISDQDGKDILVKWKMSVIGWFNRKAKIVNSPMDEKNNGQEYDVVIKIGDVDSDGATKAKAYLTNHATGEVVAKKSVSAGGSKWNTFENLWMERSEKVGSSLASFIKKYVKK